MWIVELFKIIRLVFENLFALKYNEQFTFLFSVFAPFGKNDPYSSRSK